MNELIDIACKNERSDGLNEVLKKFNLTYEKIYETPESISDFAIKFKIEKDKQFCIVPFCHTIEAEAMGGNINLGDEAAGSRAKVMVYKSIEEILNKHISYDNDMRIYKMLEACRILKNSGEKVIFTLSGPFSILSCLIDTTVIFKNWRKNYYLVINVFDHLSKELLTLADKICEAGADYISYADPIATPKILGPKYANSMAKDFTLKFLINLQSVCNKRTDIFACPVTAVSLKSINVVSMKYDEYSSEKGLVIPHCIKENNISKAILKFEIY